jgi:7-cyano-7-deazaguanine synthase in queuosine biosynthesis
MLDAGIEVPRWPQLLLQFTLTGRQVGRPLLEIAQVARDLGALPALAETHTCYNGLQPPCGECPACVLRARGFAEAGMPDPLVERFREKPS